jgi:hypothetical protein
LLIVDGCSRFKEAHAFAKLSQLIDVHAVCAPRFCYRA